MGAASDTPLLSVWPLTALPTLLPAGQQVSHPTGSSAASPPPQVRLNARRREDGVLEATAVWLEGRRPQGYRGSALVCQLDLQAREQRFKVPSYSTMWPTSIELLGRPELLDHGIPPLWHRGQCCLYVHV